jgi:hypothetical protein
MSNTSLSIFNIIYKEESLFYTKIHLKFEVLRYSCSYLWNIEQLSAVHIPQIWCYNIVPMLHLQCCGVILPNVISKNVCAV